MLSLLKRIFYIVLLLSSSSLSGCDPNESNITALKAYSEKWFRDNGLLVPAFDCQMKGTTRAGSCQFKWPPENVPQLTEQLKLLPIELKPWPLGIPIKPSDLKKLPEEMRDRRMMGFKSMMKQGCGQREPLSRMSIEQHNAGELLAFDSGKKPGPIFSGNISSSFLSFWYSYEHKTGCIDLHFPYG